MPSKTPKFDAALDTILADLKPHTRVCTETGESFEITAKDIEMLKLLRVPPPTTVWWATMRRLHAFFGGYDLFVRPVMDGSKVVSFYDPEATVPLVAKQQYHSDAYEALQFGITPSPDAPFFSSWQELSARVPRPAILQQGRQENSEWISYGYDYKDGYGCFAGIYIEDAIYSDSNGNAKHVLETTFSGWCEFSYECVMCLRSSRIAFCERCEDSADLWFCLGLRNCNDCFGCTNLKGKKFCFLNEQLTEEEYRKRLAAIDLTDARVVAEWRTKIAEVWAKAFKRAVYTRQSENVVGDDIEESRDSYGVSIRTSERAYGVYGCISNRDIMRSFYCVESERAYACADAITCSEVRFGILLDHCINVEYSELCKNCENCFGCIGLKNKKFCIFNVQYSEEEYWPRVDAVKTAMLERGEYGEFFPYRASPFAFNASHSGMMFPLSQDEVARLNARWYEAPAAPGDVEDVSAIPERLADTTDDIVKRRFRCPETGRAFFYVPRELARHRELGIALPRVHPMVGRLRRTAETLPPRLYARTCSSCRNGLQTRIPPTVTSPVLCQPCYEQVTIGEKAPPVTM